MSVRLASVVSEGLPHPEMPHCFRHWLPPFVILSAAKNLCLHCWFSVHLLFLPAAGGHRQPDYTGEGSWVIVSTCDVLLSYHLWTPGAKSATGKAYNTRWGAKSVRLASVVSEGLTQTWKCHIVFGIGCPRLSF